MSAFDIFGCESLRRLYKLFVDACGIPPLIFSSFPTYSRSSQVKDVWTGTLFEPEVHFGGPISLYGLDPSEIDLFAYHSIETACLS